MKSSRGNPKKNLESFDFSGIAGISLRFLWFLKVVCLYGLLRLRLAKTRQGNPSLRDSAKSQKWRPIAVIADLPLGLAWQSMPFRHCEAF